MACMGAGRGVRDYHPGDVDLLSNDWGDRMRKGIWLVLLALTMPALTGCTGLPSVDNCDYAMYERKRDRWKVVVDECRVFSGSGLAGMATGALK